ncbi:transducin/WD40 repeat-like superfamily protein [Actinidia rufa]|uniref:Transducin/WD40 repeat-like superfamily protein n=1 Tax=Actinidia rufa TaxID=165716 RepID=A0A7J0EKN1_9ERIC|nr:transducin/WD40 repeat-like superfamily protein [Actinidia rufa]
MEPELVIALSPADAGIGCWDLHSGIWKSETSTPMNLQVEVKSFPAELINPLTSTSDGTYIVGVGDYGDIYLWEVAMGSLLKKWHAHYRAVTCLVFSDDQSLLISVAKDGSVKSLQARHLYEYSFLEHTLRVTDIATSYGGRSAIIVSTSEDMQGSYGRAHTRGEFRQFQQETQQILRDLQQAIAALLPREPCRGVAELHQERQERDHRGHDRGPIHPNRPLAYEDESSEDEAYAHEVFGGRRDQGGRGQRDRDYQQELFRQYQECRQGVRTSEAYTEEFYRLSSRNNLPESEDQQIARFVNGLRVAIRDQVSLHTLYSLNEAVTLAKKVESQQNRTNTRSQFSTKGKQPVPSPQSQPVTNSGSQTKAATTGSTTRQGGNPNPYAKASGDKCYRCGEPGHRSNTCSKRATVNLVEPIPEEEDDGDDGGDVDPYSYDPNEFQDEEEGEYLGRSLNERKVVLGPLKESYIPKVPKEEGKSSVLLVHNEDEFDKEAKESKQIFAMVLAEGAPKIPLEVPVVVQPLIKEFQDLFPDELLAR